MTATVETIGQRFDRLMAEQNFDEARELLRENPPTLYACGQCVQLKLRDSACTRCGSLGNAWDKPWWPPQAVQS